MVQHVHHTLNQLFQTHEVMPTASSREALFSGLFELKQWHIILLGDAEERLPYIEYEDGAPVLLVFTDVERAGSAAQVWIEDRTETRVKVDSLSVEALLSILREFRLGGIEYLRFDHGPSSVRVSIIDAIAAAQVYEIMLDEGIDELVDAAVRGTESVVEGDLWDAVCELPSWYLVSDVSESDDPLVWILHDEPCVLVFTDSNRARAYAVEHGLEGCTTDVGRLIEVAPGLAMNYFRDLSLRGVAGAVFNDGPYGFYAPLDRFCDKAA
jgi:hypothetical protein